MTKYEPLEHFLRSQPTAEIAMTFHEIEDVIGAPLPPKAQNHRAWWSNNPSNNVMTKAWLAAGFVTERVDMASRRLVFRRDHPSAGPSGSGASRPGPAGGMLAALRAKLAGTVTILEGVDVTAPTGETWDAER